MAVYQTIYDYVNALGINEIQEWLEGQPKSVKAKMNTRLIQLEQLPRAQWQLTKYTGILHGDGDGLVAVKVEYRRVQYRLLGTDDAGNGFTLLKCGTEHNDRYVPPDIFKQARDRKNDLLGNLQKRRIRHDYSR